MNECYESEYKVFWADFEGGEDRKSSFVRARRWIVFTGLPIINKWVSTSASKFHHMKNLLLILSCKFRATSILAKNLLQSRD